MGHSDIASRVAALRAKLKKQGLDVLVVTKVANVSYLTGFAGDDSWALVTPRRAYLLTDSRYTEQAQSECIGCEIIERTDSLPKTVAAVLQKEKRPVGTIGLEDGSSLAIFAELKKQTKRPVQKTSDVVESIRAIKDQSEVALVKKAGKVAWDAFTETLGAVKPGITESELAGILNLNIRKRGWRESFETIVAFGPNASRPHHLSSGRKLKTNDTILIDWGVRYENYCSDLTRSFCIGKPSPLFVKAYNAVLEAQRAAIAKVKAGITAAEVDNIAREVIRKYDLPVFGHGTGHGLGLEVHETPGVSNRSKAMLQAGQVITIEPGIYIPGKLGIRIEDDVLVTEKGCKVLSPQAGEMIVL